MMTTLFNVRLKILKNDFKIKVFKVCSVNINILVLIMMKLFDFKFLILLGLTLVVYFMYKEIDMQRDRLQQCENKIKALLETNPKKFHDELEDKEGKECDNDELLLPPPPKKEITNRPQLTHPKYNEMGQQINKNILPKKSVPQKTLKLSLPVKVTVKQDSSIPETKKIESTTEVESSSENTTSVKETESEKLLETDKNKHVEIYSNDNENDQETSISDTLVNSKKQEITKLDNVKPLLNFFSS